MSDTADLDGTDPIKKRKFPGLSFGELNLLTESVLKECYAQNILNIEEYEERTALQQKAESVYDLEDLLKDLPVEMPKQQRKRESVLLHNRKSQNISIFMGEKKVAGNQLNVRYSDAFVMMGDLTLDFRDVNLPPGTTTIKLTGIMSDTKIVVPPDLCVETDVAQFMASVNESREMRTRRSPEKPVLKVIGLIFMSELKIKVKELYS